METRLFTYVSVLAKTGSYAGAARELFMTPQGLNNAIHRLEESLGVPLFDASEGGLNLTEYGRLFIEHAEAVNSELTSLQDDMRELALKHSSIIRLGSSTGFLGYIDADKILRFNETQHLSTVSIIEEVVDTECQPRLIAGMYDYALLTGPIAEPCLSSIPLVHDYLFAWVNRDNPLSSRSELTIGDLADQDVITVNQSFKGNSLLLSAFERVGVHPRMHYNNEMIGIYERVLQNKGIGITFRNHAEAVRNDSVVALPVKSLPWECALSYRSDRALLKCDQEFLKFMSTLAQFYS